MIGALSEKIITGLVSFSLLFFSSYKGNNASLSTLKVNLANDKIYLQTKLNSAFENDFEDFFTSGKNIRIWFKVDIKNKKETLHIDEFYHEVTYDPLKHIFEVNLQETEEKKQTDSFRVLKKIISEINYHCQIENLNQYKYLDIEVSCFLKEIHLQGMEKPIDLMILWKHKKPSVTIRQETSNYGY